MKKDLISKMLNGEFAIDKLENKTKKYINQLLKTEFPFLIKPITEDSMRFTVDQYAETFSEISDKVILEAIEKEELKFISGKLQFSLNACKSEIIIKLNSFFESKGGEWIIKSANIHAYSSVLNEEGLKELIEDRVVEYYLTLPSS